MKTQNNITTSSAKVIFNICLSLITYILLIIAGIIILWASAHCALYLLMLLPSVRIGYMSLIIIMAALGVLGFGLMFGLYLIKFLFSRTQNINPERIEISSTEYPELYATIREVADATYCNMPKRIYLSPDVNACVFYNTSFWNLIFPTRKNLEIGVGLINSVTVDEFKGILAHEFGHFSQKSMKVGSFVYVANTVLYNLAYQNDKWDEWVIKWTNVGHVFGFFGAVTYYFTNKVKLLLQYLFRVVNKSNMELSRQMEFDADMLAGKYIGGEVFCSALRKIEFAGSTFESTKSILHTLYEENKKINDLYQIHSLLSAFVAEKNNMVYKAGEPVLENYRTDNFPSKIAIDDAWNTHPSMENRIKQVESVNGVCEIHHPNCAWELINNPTGIIKTMTDITYSSIETEKKEDTVYIDNESFTNWINELYSKDRINDKYAPFLNREIFKFDVDEVFNNEYSDNNPLNDTNGLLCKEYQTAISDLELLQSIKNKQVEVVSITYQNILCNKKNLPIEAHQKYLEDLREKIISLDKEIFLYILSLATDVNQKQKIKTIYNNIFYTASLLEGTEPLVYKINSILYQFEITIQWSEEGLKKLVGEIKNIETHLKDLIKEIEWEQLTCEDTESQEKLIEYGQAHGKALDFSYNEEAFNDIINNTNLYIQFFSDINHKLKKELNDYILEREPALN